MNITEKQIKSQFDRIVKDGWLPYFQREASRLTREAKMPVTTARLLAIGSRETNLRNIRGDFRNGIYNGFGLMQVDIKTNPGYASRWSVENWIEGLMTGVDIYRDKILQTMADEGKSISVRGRNFFAKVLDDDETLRVATAAYNCGKWGHYHYSQGEHVDSTTTGKDYSRDVYDRAIVFARLLDEFEPGKNQLIYEAKTQGRFLRSSIAREINFPVNAEDENFEGQEGIAQDRQLNLQATDYRNDEMFEVKNQPEETGIKTIRNEDPAKNAGVVQTPTVSVPDNRIGEKKEQEKGFLATVGRFKAFLLALPTALTGIGTAVWEQIKGAHENHVMIAISVVAIVVVVYIIAHYWRETSRAKLEFELISTREKQQHEILLKQIETAADPDRLTVLITPQKRLN